MERFVHWINWVSNILFICIFSQSFFSLDAIPITLCQDQTFGEVFVVLSLDRSESYLSDKTLVSYCIVITAFGFKFLCTTVISTEAASFPYALLTVSVKSNGSLSPIGISGAVNSGCAVFG